MSLDDAGEVLLESGGQGKHLVFIRHDLAGRWWRGLYAIEKVHSLQHNYYLHTHTHTHHTTTICCKWKRLA